MATDALMLNKYKRAQAWPAWFYAKPDSRKDEMPKLLPALELTTLELSVNSHTSRIASVAGLNDRNAVSSKPTVQGAWRRIHLVA
jgi:hypothetical protein